MNLRCFSAVLALTLLAVVSADAKSKKKEGLEPFAGSYTGTAVSTTVAGTLSGSSTLTFTGRKSSLRGTFLYNGILNSGNTPRNTQLTLNISKRGIVTGRVTIDGVEGYANGQARLRGRKLAISISNALGTGPGTIVNINGAVTFNGAKRVTWSATVGSSDAGYDGTLRVTGKR